jgi:hypothetical protein
MTIGKNGNIKIDGIKGVVGPNCKKLTEQIEKLGTVLNDKKTDDFYKSDDPKAMIIRK